jgi:hypothetical protein
MLIVFSHQSGEQELDTVCGFEDLFNGHKSDCGVVDTWRITSSLVETNSEDGLSSILTPFLISSLKTKRNVAAFHEGHC